MDETGTDPRHPGLSARGLAPEWSRLGLSQRAKRLVEAS